MTYILTTNYTRKHELTMVVFITYSCYYTSQSVLVSINYSVFIYLNERGACFNKCMEHYCARSDWMTMYRATFFLRYQGTFHIKSNSA
jgi:hypothetical protein